MLGPIVIVGCVVGLRYGPVGVALGYSTALTLWFIPHIAWCVHGTVVSLRDILCTAVRPLLSGMMGAAIALGLQFSGEGRGSSALPRLVLGNAFLFSVYLAMLLYVFGQKAFYLDLLRGMRDGSPEEKKTGAWVATGSATSDRPIRTADCSARRLEAKAGDRCAPYRFCPQSVEQLVRPICMPSCNSFILFSTSPRAQ